MKSTSIAALVGASLFTAAAMLIVTWAFYGQMLATPASVSITLWLLAAICLVLGLRVRDRKVRGGIGLDSSQINPLLVANFLVIGKASAWTGAVVGGAYLGMSVYILPRVHVLLAAANDLPGVLLSASGGIALAAAGVFLERSCESPPPPEGEVA